MTELKQVFSQFLLENNIGTYQAFGNGHIHDTYRVETCTGTFIIQRINHHIFKDIEGMMTNIVLVSEYLSSQSDYTLEVLKPKCTHSGATYIQDDTGNYWRCFPFIENTATLEQLETPKQAYAIAHAFGTFIKTLSDFPVTKLKCTIPHFHNGIYRLQQLNNAVKYSSSGLKKSASTALNFIHSEQFIFDDISKLNLSTRVVHNDTKANNILMNAEGTLARCVIDLDTVMPGILLSDFGDMVRTCTSSVLEDSADFGAVEMQKPIFDALYNGFLVALGGVITVQERNALVLGTKWIILEQACRFLTDFLEGDCYYKTKYPTHNLVRAKNQIALYKSLVAQLG